MGRQQVYQIIISYLCEVVYTNYVKNRVISSNITKLCYFVIFDEITLQQYRELLQKE